jgi:hypothetical protein
MRRRDFMSLLTGVAAWPLAARAEQSELTRRIAVLMGLAENDPEGQARAAAFLRTLRELGWVDGRNIHVDWRWAAGDLARTEACHRAGEFDTRSHCGQYPTGTVRAPPSDGDDTDRICTSNRCFIERHHQPGAPPRQCHRIHTFLHL